MDPIRNQILYVVRDITRPFLEGHDRAIYDLLIGQTAEWTTLQRLTISFFLDLPQMMGDIKNIITAYKSKKERFLFTVCLQMILEKPSPNWLKILISVMREEELATAHKIIPTANFLMKYYSWKDVLDRLGIGGQVPILPYIIRKRSMANFEYEYQQLEPDIRRNIIKTVVQDGHLKIWSELITNVHSDEFYLQIGYMLFYDPINEQTGREIIETISNTNVENNIWNWIGLELRSRDDWPPSNPYFIHWDLRLVSFMWKQVGDSDAVLFKMFKTLPIKTRRELADYLI